eukprot:TRINITY_DN7868_c0_g1_i1.p1 TRINITY_DN7868_c0_g1~~TRINITY_DN7868_c0_g1_i1.p1  ORF type:complete len:293 (+),score=75.52 TRINITY_DN7868_c0_g1_i1:149-1027(+)
MKAVAVAVLSGLLFGQEVAAEKRTVVVSGATGRTGNLLYKRLKAENQWNVRAFVRNATKAKDELGCNACDESEGVFIGDVTDVASMSKVMKGADILAIATSSAPQCKGIPFIPGSCTYPKGAEPKIIDFKGTKNQVAAFASAGGDLKKKQIMYVSTMDTTAPNNFLDRIADGYVSFYHLQGEVAIMASGIPFTILKACGLSDGQGGKNQLAVGHDDSIFSFTHVVKRDDIARVLVEAVRTPEKAAGLRFDMCANWFGKPTEATDIAKDVFEAARYSWDSPTKTPSATSAIVV